MQQRRARMNSNERVGGGWQKMEVVNTAALRTNKGGTFVQGKEVCHEFVNYKGA
jgi:hypothetical protein